jgi:hypothetical protein
MDRFWTIHSDVMDRCMRGIVALAAVFLFGGILGRMLRLLVSLVCIFFPLIAPYFHACRRNAELRKYAYAGLLCGTMRSEIYTQDPNLLRLVLESPEGTVEEFIPSESTLSGNLSVPINAHALVFSDSPYFDRFTGLAEIYVPALNRFLSRSDYPFARRSKFRELSVHADMELRVNP